MLGLGVYRRAFLPLRFSLRACRARCCVRCCVTHQQLLTWILVDVIPSLCLSLALVHFLHLYGLFLPSWLPCSSVVGARATSPPFAVQSPQCPRERFPWWVHLVWFVQHAPSWPLDAPPAGTVVTPARKWHVLLVSPVLCLDNEQLLRAGVTRVEQGVHPGSSSLTVFSEFLHHA